MSAPISEIMLTHSADYYPVTGLDARGKPIYGTKVSLTAVRFTSKIKQNVMIATGEQKNDKGALYFDSSISRPSGQTFEKNGKIVYGGASYLIRDISDPSGDGGIHHVRLALVGA
jgi:hypothetical protein